MASTEEELALIENAVIKEFFTVQVNIPPRPWSFMERKNALTKSTTKWDVPPSDEVLETVAAKIGGFVSHSRLEFEQKVQNLCQGAYWNYLQKYLERFGAEKKINGKGINPTGQLGGGVKSNAKEK